MPRMPHNNRVSTSASLKTHDIWKSTIGHDPYAASEEKEKSEKARLDQEKAKTLLEIARSQNVEGGGGSGTCNDDYAKKMFFGLKGGKKRRANLDGEGLHGGGLGDKLSEDARRRLEEEESSSEDEFIEEEVEEVEEEDRKISADKIDEEKSKKKRKKKSKSKKKYYSSSSSSSSDDDSDANYHRSKRRRKKDERRKKSRKKDKGDEERKKKKSKR